MFEGEGNLVRKVSTARKSALAGFQKAHEAAEGSDLMSIWSVSFNRSGHKNGVQQYGPNQEVKSVHSKEVMG